MYFLIKGKFYEGTVKRVKGKLKIFFKTDSDYYNCNGFELPNYCCSRMKCRWKSFKEWKEDILNRRLKDVVIFPK